MTKKKAIVAPRCIHMPTKDNTVVIFSSKQGGKFVAGFTIGNQDFTLIERSTKAEAVWCCDMLEIALNTLITPKGLDKFKSEDARKLVMNSLVPKITVINLK